MRRTTTILATLLLSGSLFACSGGGDDGDGGNDDEESTTTTEEEAADLCDDDLIDALDDFVNGSDVPDFDEANAALEAVAEAEPDLEDAVEVVTDATEVAAEALDDVDPDDDDAVDEALAEVFEDLDLEEVLDAQAEIIDFVDDECDTDLGGDDETDDTISDDGGDDTSLEDFSDDVDDCIGGDMAICDQLFLETPVGSEAEEVGALCGGRSDDPIPGQCEATFG